MLRIFILMMYLCCASMAYAAKDPLTWSIYPSSGLPTSAVVGSSYAVTYTITNQLPFAVSLAVQDQYRGGSYTFTNGCNTTLAPHSQPNSSCQVHVGFQPVAAGQNSVQLTLAYHHNRVALPRLSSQVTNNITQEKITGRVVQPLPPITYLGVDYPVSFAFLNSGNVAVTATAVNVSGLTPTSNTCTAPLNPNAAPCVIEGTFTPGAIGQQSLSAEYVYAGSKNITLNTQTNVQNGSGSCHHIEAVVALPLPVTTYTYANNIIKYIFTNHCDATTETLGAISLVNSGNALMKKGQDTCSNATLAPNAACSVFVSVVPNTSTANLAVTASIAYANTTLTASATSSETVAALQNQSALHTLMFVNQCDEDVWYEFQNGNASNKSPDPTPVGQRTLSDYKLTRQLPGAAPTVKVLMIDEYINGAIYGRTGCDSNGVCATANCPVIANTGTCSPSVGATNPATIFEANLAHATAADGVYDVSMVNGFNIPGEMRSLAPMGTGLNFSNACGLSAGAPIQHNSSLGACSWEFTPPSGGPGNCAANAGTENTANYYWVAAGADDGCTSSASCSAGEYCGMAYSSNSGTAPINRRCGQFQGYWSVADWVGYSNSGNWGSCNLFDHYGMGNALPIGPTSIIYGNSTLTSGAAKYADMFACQPTTNNSLNSGYSYSLNVCGCYDWNQNGSAAPTAQAYNCIANNTQWISTVFDRIKWLKQACPTAYSYQFDDPSSQFTCNISNQKTSYQLTFCPAGKTGRPS